MVLTNYKGIIGLLGGPKTEATLLSAHILKLPQLICMIFAHFKSVKFQTHLSTLFGSIMHKNVLNYVFYVFAVLELHIRQDVAIGNFKIRQ